MDDYGIRWARGFSLQQALAMLEDDEDEDLRTVDEIAIFPPVNACEDITDEDSGDENILSVNNLPGSQLAAPAEMRLHTNDDKDEFSSEDDLPLSYMQEQKAFKDKKGKRAKKKKSYEWKHEDLPDMQSNFKIVESGKNYENMSPIELFFMFFDDDILNLILRETNNYSKMKNKTYEIDITELKAFFGVLIVSSYVPVPRRRMFWGREKDAHNGLVSEAISRDKFEYIFSNLHLVDNTNLDKQDKFAKVRPLFSKLNAKFLEHAPCEEMHSVDEAMVPYYGRHGCKQYIHGKPIRYGYKLWVGSTRLGYVNWFEPYQGSSTHVSTSYSELGVGAGVVLEYADVLRSKWSDTQFHLFFDNFFTSIPLLEKLTEKGFSATGTVRQNRLSGGPLIDDKTMKKQNRGEYDYKKIKDSNIIAVKWHDNNMVSILSNSAGVIPIHSVSRYSRTERKNIKINQPHLISLYNANMGGVDRSDENISLYRTALRGKKWYFPLITHCIDLAIHNAWQIHRKNNGDCDLLRFKRIIATTMLVQNKKPKHYQKGRPSSSSFLDVEVRYDRQDHFVISQEKQTRCGECHQRTTTRCIKCDIGVHVKCFLQYHTKK